MRPLWNAIHFGLGCYHFPLLALQRLPPHDRAMQGRPSAGARDHCDRERDHCRHLEGKPEHVSTCCWAINRQSRQRWSHREAVRRGVSHGVFSGLGQVATDLGVPNRAAVQTQKSTWTDTPGTVVGNSHPGTSDGPANFVAALDLGMACAPAGWPPEGYFYSLGCQLHRWVWSFFGTDNQVA